LQVSIFAPHPVSPLDCAARASLHCRPTRRRCAAAGIAFLLIVVATDAEGRLRFRAVVPTAYRVPTDGPVGRMLDAGGRHPWRPAHLHFMIQAPEHETLITHLFIDGDPYLDSDTVFGVRRSLVVNLERGRDGDCRLHHTFVLAPSVEPS
jgi:protocatechuate 3,4-dioxygenase beta subunit